MRKASPFDKTTDSVYVRSLDYADGPQGKRRRKSVKCTLVVWILLKIAEKLDVAPTTLGKRLHKG